MRKRKGKKLLVASLGVAAVSYVACGGGTPVANLMPPPQDSGADSAPDMAADTASDGNQDRFFPLDIVANLVAPLK
jgi:hypothetical protein